MSTSRLTTLFVVLALAAVIVFTAQKIIPALNHSYSESNDQTLREYQLGERYGEMPSNSARFTEEQSLREYYLGERYGETPQDSSRFSAEQMLREYILGERYGVTP